MGTPKNLNIDLDEDAATGETALNADSVVDEDSGKLAQDDVIDEDAEADARLPKRARPNANGSVTLPLRETVTLTTRKDGKVRDRAFNELTFFRFNGADIRAIGATSDSKMTVVTFARSTRIPELIMDKLFDKLDGSDITDGLEIIASFLRNGPRTGR